MTHKSAQAPELYLEDLAPGLTFDLGSRHVTRDEIIDFAMQFDPQPFHLDDQAAASNPLLGRLCASGIHTLALSHSVQMRGFERVGIRPLAGAGMDEMRLPAPVFPDDTINVAIEILETKHLRSYDDRGILSYLTRVSNQDGLVVLTYRSALFMARRPRRAAAAP